MDLWCFDENGDIEPDLPENVERLDSWRVTEDGTVMHEILCVKCMYRPLAVAPAGLALRNYCCPNCSERGGIIKTGQEYTETGRALFSKTVTATCPS